MVKQTYSIRIDGDGSDGATRHFDATNDRGARIIAGRRWISGCSITLTAPDGRKSTMKPTGLWGKWQ